MVNDKSIVLPAAVSFELDKTSAFSLANEIVSLLFLRSNRQYPSIAVLYKDAICA